jgi:hypothetical protein
MTCTRTHPRICMYMWEYKDRQTDSHRHKHTYIYTYIHTHTHVMYEILYMSTIINTARVQNFEDI